MKVIIMRGIPGSGKSTYVRERWPHARVFSADHYFTGPDGIYRFRPEKLGEAHGKCLRDFALAAGMIAARRDMLVHIAEAEVRRHDDLVVDNTNIRIHELAPYVALAEAYGIPVEIHTLIVPPAVAAARCVHDVPAPRIHALWAELNEELYIALPHRWARYQRIAKE